MKRILVTAAALTLSTTIAFAGDNTVVIDQQTVSSSVDITQNGTDHE